MAHLVLYMDKVMLGTLKNLRDRNFWNRLFVDAGKGFCDHLYILQMQALIL